MTWQTGSLRPCLEAEKPFDLELFKIELAPIPLLTKMIKLIKDFTIISDSYFIVFTSTLI